MCPVPTRDIKETLQKGLFEVQNPIKTPLPQRKVLDPSRANQTAHPLSVLLEGQHIALPGRRLDFHGLGTVCGDGKTRICPSAGIEGVSVGWYLPGFREKKRKQYSQINASKLTERESDSFDGFRRCELVDCVLNFTQLLPVAYLDVGENNHPLAPADEATGDRRQHQHGAPR